jgi:hypothetical protein
VAMTPAPERPEPPASPRDDAMLEQAAQSLREHVDQRWVQISDRVLTRAMRATRTSLAVQARAPSGPVHISEQVLITHVRDAIGSVPHVKIQDVVITTEGLDTYTGLTITISARFGVPLIPIADTIRDLANTRLVQLLGPITPPVTVTTMDVHVQDVFHDGGGA